MEAELHLYKTRTDTVVARSLDDATAVIREHYDDDHESIFEGLAQVDDDAPLTIWSDNDLDYGTACEGCGYGLATSPNGHQRGCPIGHPTKTAREWASEEGRGFLCSTEY